MVPRFRRLRNWKKMGARKLRGIHDVEKTKKMVPFITREITFGQHVRELGFRCLEFWGPS